MKPSFRWERSPQVADLLLNLRAGEPLLPFRSARHLPRSIVVGPRQGIGSESADNHLARP